MNNKGQILPLFVILVPILIIFISYMVDLGIMYSEKRKMTNTVKDAITYYIDNLEKDNVYTNTLNILNKNISNGKIQIDYNEEYITISVTKEYSSIYNIVNFNNKISVKYKGYYNNKRIVKG